MLSRRFTQRIDDRTGGRSELPRLAGDETHFERDIARNGIGPRWATKDEQHSRRGPTKKETATKEAWARYVRRSLNVVTINALGVVTQKVIGRTLSIRQTAAPTVPRALWCFARCMRCQRRSGRERRKDLLGQGLYKARLRKTNLQICLAGMGWSRSEDSRTRKNGSQTPIVASNLRYRRTFPNAWADSSGHWHATTSPE